MREKVKTEGVLRKERIEREEGDEKKKRKTEAAALTFLFSEATLGRAFSPLGNALTKCLLTAGPTKHGCVCVSCSAAELQCPDRAFIFHKHRC